MDEYKLIKIYKDYKLNEEELTCLSNFYLSFLGYKAYAFYLFLNYAINNNYQKKDILRLNNLSNDQFEGILKVLNKYQLLKVYENSEHYLYYLQRPLDLYSFLKLNPKLNNLAKAYCVSDYKFNYFKDAYFKLTSNFIDLNNYKLLKFVEEEILNDIEFKARFLDVENFKNTLIEYNFTLEKYINNEFVNNFIDLSNKYFLDNNKLITIISSYLSKNYKSKSNIHLHEIDFNDFENYIIALSLKDNLHKTKLSYYDAPFIFLEKLIGDKLTPYETDLIKYNFKSDLYHINIFNATIEFLYKNNSKNIKASELKRCLSFLKRNNITSEKEVALKLREFLNSNNHTSVYNKPKIEENFAKSEAIDMQLIDEIRRKQGDKNG